MTEQDRTSEKNLNENSRALPPEARERPDSFVRATQPGARQEMGRGDDTFDETGFAKGDNYPTANQTGLPYTVEDYDRELETAPKGLFPDSPGVGKLMEFSPEREPFLENMMQIGHFETQEEAERWTKAVFNALRVRAIETDNTRSTVFDDVVHTSEAPELQVRNMMWAGDFIARYRWLASHLDGWSKEEFCKQVANYARTQRDDPWCEAAIFAFFGALKRANGQKLDGLGEFQDIWDRA